MDYKLEYLKCYKDKSRQYFIENYLSTYNASERKEVPFKLFPRQIELIKAFGLYNNIITIKPRQSGITTVTSAFIAAQIVFANPTSPETILCIGNKLDISQQLLEKIAEFLEQVPRWMWGSDYFSPDPNSPKNIKSIYKTRNKARLELFNGCKVYARSSGTSAARGISAASYLVIDECAFLQNGVTVYTQALATTNSVKDPHVILISTPNGKDPLYYNTYSKAVKKENNFHVVEFRWFQDPRYNRHLKWSRKNANGEVEWNYDTVIDKKGNIVYDEKRWKQLEQDGWKPTSPWYENTCKSFNNDEIKINQEINVSFLGSSDNVVPVDTIEMQLQQNVIEITDDWNLKDLAVHETWIWKDPIPNHRYIIACLPEGENILTTNGSKKIENITFNDTLISKEGKETKIKRIIKREYNGNVYGIKVKNFLDVAKFTGNHPIWSSIDTKIIRPSNKNRVRIFNFKFNNADALSVGDWIEIPNLYKTKTLNNSDIMNKWAKYEKISRCDYKIKNPLLNEEFWYYCGMWLAEGYTLKDKYGNISVCTCHHINENIIHKRLYSIINGLFNRTPNHRSNIEQNSKTIKFSSKQIGCFLNDNFGKYAYGKYIAEWIKFLPIKFKLKLIEGYLMGDGSILKNNTSCYVSVSRQLLEDIQHILFSIGIISSLKQHNSEYEGVICGRKVSCLPKYMLMCGKYDTKKLLDLLHIKNSIIIKESRRKLSNCYFSEDETKIYSQISKITIEKYNGIVYNFETNAHTYCTKNIATHNCDPSSGSGEDFTAIQVIDVDAIDKNGIPCFEQVLEYNGKLNGNEVAQLIDRYGKIYNEALAVVEAIGGYGDSIVLSLLEMNYPNLYYDDPSLKNYTNTNLANTKNIGKENEKQLPGFRTNSLRLQMISNFVNMLKDNSFRVHSMRTINELETWVYKNGRPDHMDGQHDDLLTCLAMGLFVMQFYMIRRDKIKAKDSTIVSSWFVASAKTQNYNVRNLNQTIDISSTRPKHQLPFYSSKGANDEQRRFAAMMLLGCVKEFKKTHH